MSYNTPVPPLVPFSQSPRRPISQPPIIVENVNEQDQARSSTGGKKGAMFPPLISALDTYLESSIDTRAEKIIAQVDEIRRLSQNQNNEQNKKKKKRQKLSAKKKAVNTAVKSTKQKLFGQVNDILSDSSETVNQTNEILNLGSSNTSTVESQELSDTSQDSVVISGSFRSNMSPRALLAAKYLSTPQRDSNVNVGLPIAEDFNPAHIARRPEALPTSSLSANKAIVRNNRLSQLAALPEVSI